MTDQIIPDEAVVVEYSPSVPTTIFTIPFRFFADEDIKVATNTAGTIVDLVLVTDFSVQGTVVDGGLNGGTITLVSSIDTPVTLKIYREIPTKRTTNFPVTGPFDIGELNNELNKIIAITQQQFHEVQNQFLKLPSNSFSSSGFDFENRFAINVIEDPDAGDTSLTTRLWQTTNLGGFIQEATSAEIDTGTVLGKYLSPKRMKDSTQYDVFVSNFTPTYNGFSVDPSANPGTVENRIHYRIWGKWVLLLFDIGDGTSDSTVFEITNLPSIIQPAREQVGIMAGGKDNGSLLTSPMLVNVQGGPTIRFGINTAFRVGGGWTASGGKGLKNSSTSSANIHDMTFMYEKDGV